jgi:outer membrane biosynthesis protein TonB
VQAGISPGAGVTVVLRLEVRGDGTVSQVQIDVSGGAHLIDEAAIAYVHAVKWVGGRIDDKPESIWIRWGVRLDG